MSDTTEISDIIEDATFDFTMGDSDHAISKLEAVLDANPESFEAWHALCEIHYSAKSYEAALRAAEQAHSIRPDDLFINTSLSRIWLELGSKEKAEHFGAQSKVASWKEQLKNPEASQAGLDATSP